MKIHPQRLSRYIMSRKSINSQEWLLEFYDSLSKEQRSEIKNMFIENKKINDI